jgi:hypothetical protein
MGITTATALDKAQKFKIKKGFALYPSINGSNSKALLLFLS